MQWLINVLLWLATKLGHKEPVTQTVFVNDPTQPATLPDNVDWVPGSLNITALLAAALKVFDIFVGEPGSAIQKIIDLITLQLKDPDFVALIDSILASLKVRSNKDGARDAAIKEVAEANATPELKQRMALMGFDWEKFITDYLPDIIRILLSLLKKR